MSARSTEVDQGEMLALLREAQARLEEAERRRLVRMAEANLMGASWQQIGRLIGRTKETARHMVRHLGTR